MESDYAWAAGLFEGEGTITSCRGRPRLALKMVDPEPVQRFAEIMGGRVYGPYVNRSGEKDGYPRSPFVMWVLEADAARGAFLLIQPWLSSYRLRRFSKVFG